MNLFFHRFIILLLVLQGFTPLVHAHVQMLDSIDEGIHIDEISRAWHEPDDALLLSAIDHHSAVVDMQTAIQEKKLLLDGKLLNAIFIGTQHHFIRSLIINKLIGFSPPVSIVKPSVSLSVIVPRAPQHCSSL